MSAQRDNAWLRAALWLLFALIVGAYGWGLTVNDRLDAHAGDRLSHVSREYLDVRFGHVEGRLVDLRAEIRGLRDQVAASHGVRGK